MASVPITVLRYNGPLLCGFNVTMKGLMSNAQLAQRCQILPHTAKKQVSKYTAATVWQCALTFKMIKQWTPVDASYSSIHMKHETAT